MSKFGRGLSVVAVLALLLTGIVFAQAQEATEEPTQEMTTEPMAETTTEPMAETTTEPAAEATMEATQDANMTGSQPGSLVCSADLIAQLYVAERYFDFGTLNDQWMQSGASTLDLNQFERGQFSGLFDNMMQMPPSMTAEQSTSVTEMMLMDDATFQQNMGASNTVLTPATFADDPPQCATLRATLNRFWMAVAAQDMNMSGGTTDTSPEATTEAGAEATTEAGTSTTGSQTNVNFSTTLSGTNEIPGPGDPDGTGTAAITIDFANSQVCYNVSVQNLTLPAAAMHIHSGNADESGPVVIPFDRAPDESGNATGCVLVSDTTLLSQIAEGPASFYVNVHTSDFPDGAVRGQVAG